MIDGDDPAARAGDDTTESLSRAAASQRRRRTAHEGAVMLHLEPGTVLAGRYRIASMLGEGGMGTVYRARDEELSIDVALKILRVDVSLDRESLQRLKCEVLLARAVTHPSVCRVFDLGKHGVPGALTWFLTMEHLSGRTLAALLRQGRLSTADALPVVKDMVTGLTAAHRAGVIHRDFKSSNVMLVAGERRERAVVMDFGLARAVGPAVRSPGADEAWGTEIVGTPAYMAPEQVRGEQLGPAADVYALGCVLYEMVTGRLPFRERTPLETARARLASDPTPPSHLVPDLLERWEWVILKCLSRDPVDRFDRAELVAAELTAGTTHVVEARARVTPSTLPTEHNRFCGRETELAEIGRKLEGAPIVTLLGPAGIGKTRLALRYARQESQRWPGGVWFVDLQEARSANEVARCLAGVLGVPLGRGNVIDQLSHAIAARGRSLLILDNFDRLTAHADTTVGAWARVARDATFLTTSRERLNVTGEEILLIDPLSMGAAVELFADRARAHRPGYDPVAVEPEATREVANLLEGIPLAIELAAARVRVMTVSQLIGRMRERLRLLAGSGSGRHATLRTAIDGSWELLPSVEQEAFAQCAVFEGGASLEAIEAVLDLGAGGDAPWTIDVVQSLVEKSLLRTWLPEEALGPREPSPRFGMFASLQAYALEKLAERGEVAQRNAESRHGRCYARLGTMASLAALDGPAGVPRRRALGYEIENLVAACRRAIARGDGSVAADTYRAIWAVLQLRGPFGLAIELGEAVIRMVTDPGDRARALLALGQAVWHAGLVDKAQAFYEEAHALHTKAGDRPGQALVLHSLANLNLHRSNMAVARAQYEEVLAIHRETGDRAGEAITLGNLGNLHWHLGMFAEARPLAEAALALHREVGDRRCEGIALGKLAEIERADGRRIELARELFAAALAIHREVGDRRFEGVQLANMGTLAWEQGEFESGAHRFNAALAIFRELGDRRPQGILLINLGNVHFHHGRFDEARADYDAALAILRETGDRGGEALALGNLGHVCLATGDAVDARAHIEAAIALRRTLGDAYHEGKLHGDLGNALEQLGCVNEAQQALDRGESLLRNGTNPEQLGLLLCVRASVELRHGDRAAAMRAYADAERIASGLAGHGGALRRELEPLRSALTGDGPQNPDPVEN